MESLRDYCAYLQDLIAARDSSPRRLWLSRLPPVFDGQPSRVTRLVVEREVLKSLGAFFTGHELANETASLANLEPKKSTVLDPACGSGDLLIAAAKKFSVTGSPNAALAEWSNRLLGFDIDPTFAEIARLRLRLLFLSTCRGAPDSHVLRSSFPKIRPGDFLSIRQQALAGVTDFILNPPFISMKTPEGCDWSTGSVSAAAVFVDRCARMGPPGSNITAILPDVLRSGSRYASWRRNIKSRFETSSRKSIGPFCGADIDVFFLVGRARLDAPIRALMPKHRSSNRLARICDAASVSVGAVVPYRHVESGNAVAFLDVRGAPAWKTVNRIYNRIRFSGTVHKAPFIAIRRTSSPSDNLRAIATIVSGKRNVAVENHLLVLKPHSGTLSDCRKLLMSLQHPRTTGWLNRRIRCRHLTAKSIQQLPIWGEQ